MKRINNAKNIVSYADRDFIIIIVIVIINENAISMNVIMLNEWMTATDSIVCC